MSNVVMEDPEIQALSKRVQELQARKDEIDRLATYGDAADHAPPKPNIPLEDEIASLEQNIAFLEAASSGKPSLLTVPGGQYSFTGEDGMARFVSRRDEEDTRLDQKTSGLLRQVTAGLSGDARREIERFVADRLEKQKASDQAVVEKAYSELDEFARAIVDAYASGPRGRFARSDYHSFLVVSLTADPELVAALKKIMYLQQTLGQVIYRNDQHLLTPLTFPVMQPDRLLHDLEIAFAAIAAGTSRADLHEVCMTLYREKHEVDSLHGWPSPSMLEEAGDFLQSSPDLLPPDVDSDAPVTEEEAYGGDSEDELGSYGTFESDEGDRDTDEDNDAGAPDAPEEV